MTLDEFWNIVDRVHSAAGFKMKSKVPLLAAELRKLPPDEILSWRAHYGDQRNRANHWDIHAICVLFNGFTSCDGFMDFRSDLVSCGRQIFEAVINDPDCLGDLVGDQVDIGIEGYQYVAPDVYEELAGKIMKFSGEIPPIAGEEWHSKDDLERRFPRMWARFNDRLMID